MRKAGHQTMVRWFSLRELLRTGAEAMTARAFTRLLDPRVLLPPGDPSIPHYWQDRDEVWLDFVADTGDGWNPTFAVARTLAADRLELRDPSGRMHSTRRAQILVFGGDLVYPTPRDGNYEKRLLAPFREALEKTVPPHPWLLAIPGNHDWYDGLREFTRLFCHPSNAFAGWETQQTRSYFAFALPGDWWLLAIDLQLGAELDRPQLDYFERVKGRMSPRGRVILCIPGPDWLEIPPERRETDTLPIEQMEELLGRPIDLCLAGNLHHYRRHVTISRDSGQPALQRITAGGGGAFLHATHEPLHRRLRNRLEQRASFPTPEDSRRQLWRLLLFPLHNWGFGIVPATIYALMAWNASGPTPQPFGLDVFAPIFARTLWGNLAGVIFLVGFSLLTLAFCERRSRRSFALACGHLAAQLTAITLVCFASLGLAERVFPAHWLLRTILLCSLGAVGGWLVGSTLVGIYLWISARCNRLLDYAYAALRIEDWKSFLRLRITRDGTLTVFPIGIERVPRSWARRTGADGESRLEPDDPRATPPELVEMPVRIRPA